MKYFWATRDRGGCVVWLRKPNFEEREREYIDGELIPDLARYTYKKFKKDFGITLKMNECKKVTIRLEEAE